MAAKRTVRKVALYGPGLKGYGRVEEGATVGAILGENLFNPDGSLVTVRQFSSSTTVVTNTATSGGTAGPTGPAGVRVVQPKAVGFTAAAVAGTDYVHPCTGTITATLPTAVGNTSRYTIKNAGVGVISVASTSAQTFDGTASPIAIPSGNALEFISDGTNWIIL